MDFGQPNVKKMANGQLLFSRTAQDLNGRVTRPFSVTTNKDGRSNLAARDYSHG